MRLNQVQQSEQVNRAESSSNVKAKNMKSLSKEEEMLIQDKFPKGMNRKLELYLATGSSRTEQPASKGQNFDFRV